MIVFAFLIGGIVGFSACALFSGKQYDKGYWDGYKFGHRRGYDFCKKEEKIFGAGRT